MSLSRSFKETVKARAARDPAFRAALLGEAVEAFAAGEADTGKALIRDYINATLGFDTLGAAVSIDPKNLMRMFGPRGNPRLGNLSAVLRELNRREAVHLKVEPERLAGCRPKPDDLGTPNILNTAGLRSIAGPGPPHAVM